VSAAAQRRVSVVIALFHLVWCVLLWMLDHPSLGRKRVAWIAILAGAAPRVFVAIALLPTAWLRDSWGYAELIAILALTILWFPFLWLYGSGRDAVLPKLAFPMTVFAGLECIGALLAASNVIAAAVSGSVPSYSWVAAASLVRGAWQFWYLREQARTILSRP